MRKAAAKNILMKDGSVRRVPTDQCELLLKNGQARRFISNTIYRAVKLGIEVKNHGTRDDDGSLRKQIQAARAKAESKKSKKKVKEVAG